MPLHRHTARDSRRSTAEYEATTPFSHRLLHQQAGRQRSATRQQYQMTGREHGTPEQPKPLSVSNKQLYQKAETQQELLFLKRVFSLKTDEN